MIERWYNIYAMPIRVSAVYCLPFSIYLIHSKKKALYFYAQYMRISAHREQKGAIVAVAHSILLAIFHILKCDYPFRDLGADHYNQFNRERRISAYLKKLIALGCELSPAAC